MGHGTSAALLSTPLLTHPRFNPEASHCEQGNHLEQQQRASLLYLEQQSWLKNKAEVEEVGTIFLAKGVLPCA